MRPRTKDRGDIIITNTDFDYALEMDTIIDAAFGAGLWEAPLTPHVHITHAVELSVSRDSILRRCFAAPGRADDVARPRILPLSCPLPATKLDDDMLDSFSKTFLMKIAVDSSSHIFGNTVSDAKILGYHCWIAGRRAVKISVIYHRRRYRV